MKYKLDKRGRRYPSKKPKQSASMREVWKNQEYRTRIGKSLKKVWTPNKRKSHSKILRKACSTKEARERLTKAAFTARTWERKSLRKLVDEGWEVLKTGWPDFICIRGNKIRFIEAKSPKARLPEAQRRVHEILKKFGIIVEVITEEK